jgi:hypothetical protein
MGRANNSFVWEFQLTAGTRLLSEFDKGGPISDLGIRIQQGEPNLIFGQIALSIACRLRRDGRGFCQQIKWLA